MAEKETLIMEIDSNVKAITKQVEDLTKAAKDTSKETKNIGVSFKGLLKGAGVIAVLSAVFEKFKELLEGNQKTLDLMATASTALGLAFNDLFNFLSSNLGSVTGFFKDLFENPMAKLEEFSAAIKEGFIDRFNQLVEVLGLAGKAFGQLIKGEFDEAFSTIKEAGKESVDVITGVDKSFDTVKETIKKTKDAIVDYTKSTIEQAVSIEQTKKAAGRAAVEFAKLNAQFLKEAEDQRQIRDDVNRSFADRIKANEDLSKILAKQQKAQKEQLQTQLDAAQAQFKLTGLEEDFIALQEQKVAMLELEETINGQLSEQKTNQTALENELLDAQRQVRAESLSGMERELEDARIHFEEMKKLADLSGEETTALTAKFEKQKAQIIATSVNEQLARYSALGGALQGLAGESKALSLGTAIIDTYAAANAVLKDPTLVGSARFIAAATAITTGLANVRQIMQTNVGSGGGGGGVGVSAPATPAPQMMSGQFELGGGITPEPVKAFVVTDEMTNSQNQLANIRRRATI